MGDIMDAKGPLRTKIGPRQVSQPVYVCGNHVTKWQIKCCLSGRDVATKEDAIGERHEDDRVSEQNRKCDPSSTVGYTIGEEAR